MREFTKSMASFSWAMTMFGVQQMLNIMTPRQTGQRTDPATRAFDEVTKATREEFGDTVKSFYRVGNNFQQSALDIMLESCSFQNLDFGRMMRTTTETMCGSARDVGVDRDVDRDRDDSTRRRRSWDCGPMR